MVPFLSVSRARCCVRSDCVTIIWAIARPASHFSSLKSRATRHADEVDAIGKARGLGGGDSGTAEREQGLLQLLCEMDGFRQNDRVLVIGATNMCAGLHQSLLTSSEPHITSLSPIVARHAACPHALHCAGVAQPTLLRSGPAREKGLWQPGISPNEDV